MKLGRLKQNNPRLDLNQVRILHALYRGGRHLLGDNVVMEEIFPSHMHELPKTHQERRKRAFYENLFAMVINQMSALLAQDPARLAHTDETSEAEKPSKYWIDLMEDAGAPGAKKRTYDAILRNGICIEALTTGWSWVHVDLPAPPEPDDPGAPNNLAEQEQAGLLRAYVVPWPSNCVTDWEYAGTTLLWVRTYECIQISETADAPRNVKIHRWTVWDAAGWCRYEIEERKDKPFPNTDDTDVPIAKEGTHSFGCVPWIQFDLCTLGDNYLHVGDLIASLCIQYFNRSNGEAFQWTQFNYQQLYEFLGKELGSIDEPVGAAQQNPSRAHERRAPGMVHVRGSEDKAMFVGPQMTGADVGRQSIQDLRDAVLRVIQQMALSQDTSGAMLRRSGDSKKQDAIAQEILAGAVGKELLTFGRALAELLARGVSETVPDLEGYAKFSITDVNDVIQNAVLIETIDIPSATFHVEHKYDAAVTILGDGKPDAVKLKIRQELEGAITQDAIEAMKQMPLEQHEKNMKGDPDVDQGGKD